MKNIMKKILAMILVVISVLSVVACTGKQTSGVCEIKALVSGYGVDWLHAAVAAFNDAFKNKGYEVKVTLTDSDINAAQEILSPKRNTTDLYFDSNNINTYIEKSRSVLGSKGGALLEDLTDLLNSKAVNLKGEEEGDIILNRLDEEFLAMCKYTGRLNGFDGYYGTNVGKMATGVYVNKKVLTQKGYSLNDLLTTDSLLKVVAELAPANPLDENEFFPISWSGLKAPGYWDYLAEELFAQYTGKKNFDNFWDFIPQTGTLEDNGWQVYTDRGIYEALKVVEELINTDLSVPGTASMEHIAAQSRVFTGKSLLVVSGDWIYKEMEKDFSQYIDDVVPIKTPMLSALGVKLQLCGSTHAEGDVCANCDEILKNIAIDVDELILSDAEIAQKHPSVSATTVAAIRERRGYYLVEYGPNTFIPSYSDAKETAKMFLRFLFSSDGERIYQENTHEWGCAESIIEPDLDSLSEIDKAIYLKKKSDNVTSLRKDTSSVMRSQNRGLGLAPEYGSPYIYSYLAYSHSTSKNPSVTAESAFTASKRKAEDSWLDWLANAGLNQR